LGAASTTVAIWNLPPRPACSSELHQRRQSFEEWVMVCPACGAQAHGDARFCSACGFRLPAACPACRAPVPLADRFCEQCGIALRAAPSQTPRPTLGDSATGERRHVTVLFSDLVNSTAIAAQLDPEEWRELAASYQRAAAEAVSRFGGHVA